MTHNPAEQWVWSNDAAHEALVTTQLFDTVKKIHQQRARMPQRLERPGRQPQGQRTYALRGRVPCETCGRKMQPATIRNTVYYRCEFKEQEQSLHPGLDHPRTVYLREDVVCRALDRWIAKAFAPDRLAATLTALAQASAAAHAAETLSPQQTQARKTVKECERRLARCQAALEAGADPPSSLNGSTRRRRRRRQHARSSTHHLPPLERRKLPSEPTRSGRSLRDSETSRSVCRPSTQRRRARSPKPSGSRSVTNMRVGPRPLGRGPHPRIAIASVRGGT